MKKNIVIPIIILVLIASLGGYLFYKKGADFKLENAVKFKNEYESLNVKINENNGREYKSVVISKDNPIVYADINKIMEILDGTGVIYFGFPECPWCRNVIPVLLDAAREVGIKKVFYINNRDTRDTRSLDDEGNIVVEKEGSEEYYKLLEKLGEEFTEEYGGLNDPIIRRLYFPTVIVVKDGKVLGSIVGSLDSQEDPYVSLTEEQEKELKTKYTDLMKKIK